MTGRLALTFDDRHIGSWLAARPLLDAASARVTFFIVEADLLDDDERAGVHTLLADGHRIGSHGLRHLDADERIAADGADAYLTEEIDPSIRALESLGADVRTFAYPNSRRDAASDAALLTRFAVLRGGGPRTLDPAEAAAALRDPDADTRVLTARGIDTGRGDHQHPPDADVMSALLRRLAETGGSLVVYAHDIAVHSATNHVHPERLQNLLAEAEGLGIDLVGMDELTEGHHEA